MAPTLVNSLKTFLVLTTLTSTTYAHPSNTPLVRRAPTVPATLPGTWTSQGCYSDAVGSRTLGAKTYQDGTGMTVESCISFCETSNYVYAGTEYSQECYCANAIATSGAQEPLSDCNMACTGNANEACGGPNRINVFWSGAAPPAGPSTKPSSGLWASMGCYTDDTAARTLPDQIGTQGAVDVETCTAACQLQNYLLAGMEYGQECWCANDFANNGAPAASGCNMACAGDSSEYCGGSFRLNVYAFNGTFTPVPVTETPTPTPTPTPAPTTTPAAGGWSSLGCFTDNVASRTLRNRMGTQGAVTIESCTAACKSAGYVLAGTEYSTECYCDNAVSNGGGPAPDGNAQCNMACEGNAQEMCGGPNRLNVYTFNNAVTVTTTSTTTAPTSVASGWTAAGCYSDSTAARALQYGPMPITGQLTNEKCQAACQAQNWNIAGTEYSVECYCDTDFRNNQAPATDGCNMPCSGDAAETCGGPDRLTVFTYGAISTPTDTTTPTGSTTSANPTATGWNTIGCYTDNVNQRTLTVGIGMGGANSVEKCTTACFNAGYAFAGMEYSNECYCDTTIKNGGGPAPDGDAQCNMACSGDAAEICGGPNRLNVYQYTGDLPTTPTDPNQGGGGGGAGGTGTPVTEGLPTPWHYSGCYVDNANGRVLAAQQPDNNQLTVESCINACNGLGYTLAGMEFGVQCFCDNYVINGGVKSASDADCSMSCGGNTVEGCGGPNRMSIYTSTDPVVLLPVPIPQTTDLPGQWEYKGCLKEPGAARVFPYQLILKTNNSATNCLSQCSKYGYPAAGMEYGEECYCGDVSDIAANGGTGAPDGDCNMACSGDPIHHCGGPERLSYYEWTGTPLNNWGEPTNKGAYQFLIGGLVIPLVASLGLNNKVSFVEKLGTGPPNSTGAYELDYSLVNDFDAAWREMHVKSDVFCSASLILPDKAGRQINVGGWSLESTYGIRLYAPDGSPGQPSVNDWEENYNELALQRGRWYPSAMIMANGSILVVGGEAGSNGAPVPSLEILPRTPGGETVLTMDWLQRTDPYNLYPFLYVLPSGGIFVQYYNEARVLNENTFETIKVLPNVPGAVNDFTAGRTYPLEGTAVFLPQHAPYTDPVTFMVCGGSTTGAAVALDNCASIQPDLPDAQWTIERMPSKRVMTCMVTLPDGTFLILNGAQQGVAGFGLATEPNHQAILYDPSQPVGSRMSNLNTTIVDRMYHSEAILLHDGRVLVSGSDPQDARFPQEYRIEAFSPPYLMQGLTQPQFTLAQNQWNYNGQYDITVNLFNGGVGTMKVSLLAAVSSTHGNSMNQRAIFPAFTCTGNACKITAPPNAHICPPGWFQLFVLDGPTPSFSQWVRIGGDPAALGNWPAGADFTRPGL